MLEPLQPACGLHLFYPVPTPEAKMYVYPECANQHGLHHIQARGPHRAATQNRADLDSLRMCIGPVASSTAAATLWLSCESPPLVQPMAHALWLSAVPRMTVLHATAPTLSVRPGCDLQASCTMSMHVHIGGMHLIHGTAYCTSPEPI